MRKNKFLLSALAFSIGVGLVAFSAINPKAIVDTSATSTISWSNFSSANRYGFPTTAASSETTYTDSTHSMSFRAINTKVNQGYLMINSSGYVYNQTAIDGYITKIKITFNTGNPSTKAKCNLGLGTSSGSNLQGATSSTTQSAGGTAELTDDGTSKFSYFSIRAQSGNIQAASITITYTSKTINTVSFDANGGDGEMQSISSSEAIYAPECDFSSPEEGKMFSHWNTESDDSGSKYEVGDLVPNSCTLYAIWLGQYVVTYDWNDGIHTSSQYVLINKKTIVTDSIPTKDGYSFLYWNTDPAGEEGVMYIAGQELGPSESDITLYAIWHKTSTEEEPYTVSQAIDAYLAGVDTIGAYVSGYVCQSVDAYFCISTSGSTVEQQIYFQGTSFHYRDIGNAVVVRGDIKHSNSNGGFYYLDNPELIKNTQMKVIVSFNPNGGTGTMDSIVIDRYTKIDFPISTLGAPEGKGFIGWKDNESTNNIFLPSYYSRYKYTSGPIGLYPEDLHENGPLFAYEKEIKSDNVFSAHWGKIKNIKFYVYYGAPLYNQVVFEDTCLMGGIYVLPELPVDVPEGKIFAGWTENLSEYTTSHKTSFIQKPGYLTYLYDQYFTTVLNEEVDTISVSAVFSDIYTVEYNMNLEGVEQDPIIDNYAQYFTMNIRSNPFDAPSNKKFIGWNTEPDGTGVSYKESSEYTINNSLTLYAQWQDVYSVTYKANYDGTEDVVNVFDAGEDFNIEANTFETPDEYHRFLCWNTESDGSGVTYNPGDPILNINHDFVLYAQWELIPPSFTLSAETNPTRTITFDSSNGAEYFGLDDSIWHVTVDKHDSGTGFQIVSGQMRIYSQANSVNGGELRVRSLHKAYKMTRVIVDYGSSHTMTMRSLNLNNQFVKNINEGDGGVYEINNYGFSLQNVYSHTKNSNTRINSIVVEYSIEESYQLAKNYEDSFIKRDVEYGVYTQDGSNCKAVSDGGLGYYDIALSEYDNLTQESRIWFASHSDFVKARERMIAWARANGKQISFDPETGDIEQITMPESTAFNLELSNENNNISLVIIIVSSVSLLALTSLLLIKKKTRR